MQNNLPYQIDCLPCNKYVHACKKSYKNYCCAYKDIANKVIHFIY